ncbi:MAG TPA: flagellar motor switch protein FliM [Steroidobacteraceae bacterium]|nr:flagellar motor switch protein FliM [Steroidobacteraceae bacterium]
MAGEMLDQDEIDALLRGVDANEVAVGAGTSVPGEVRNYDIATQVRIVRGRMPTLEMINDRFARLLRIGLYNMVRRTPEIAVAPVQVLKFSEYVHTLHVPASLNLVKFAPLRGTALFVLDSKLVFTLVDNFFGGSGRHAKIEGRDFTGTEGRIIQIVLRQAFNDLKEAWAPVCPLNVEYLNSEMNPQFANIVSPSEIVVITCFRIDLEGGGGELHVTMPYSMIEPIRDLLDSGIQSDRAEGNERWSHTLREEIQDVSVNLVPLLGNASMTVGQLLELKPGDVIPCDFDGTITLLAEGVPFLRGSYGLSRGQQAIKVVDCMPARRQGARNPPATP